MLLPFLICLGTGAFGVVFLGLWKGNTVAVKKINDSIPQLDPEWRNEFLSEADTMSKLTHPNVVHFYGVTVEPYTIVTGSIGTR